MTACRAEPAVTRPSATAIPLTTAGPSATEAPTARLADVRRFAAALEAAVTARDHARYQSLLSARDPAFTARATAIFDNLAALPLTRFELRIDAVTAPLDGPRRSLLGDAWVQRGTVQWRLAGERGSARQAVWLTLVTEPGGVRLAGTTDRPTDEPAPLWWTGSVRLAAGRGLVVIAGAGQSADGWAGPARAARQAVARELPEAAGRWQGPLVVEVPATERDLEAALARRPGSLAGTAAVTVPEGDAADAPVRVFVNPRLADAPAATRRAVLTHEAVHVATRSAESPAPLWAVEGLAEWLAWRDQPRLAVDGASGLLRAVRQGEGPRDFPTAAELDGAAPRVRESYAAAWLLCRSVADRHGSEGLGRWYAALDAGRTPEEASREALGIGLARVRADWRRDLARWPAAG